MAEQESTTAAETPARKPIGKIVTKVLGIILEVFLVLLLLFTVFVLIVSVRSKKNNDGAADIFGYEMRLVISDSMEKSANSIDVSDYEIKDLKVKSLLFIEKVPEDDEKADKWYASLKAGDVLTFRFRTGASQQTITHRIIAIDKLEQGGYHIQLQGDNRGEGENVTAGIQDIYTAERATSPNYVIGKVKGNSVFLGYIVYALKQPIGIALMIILPCALIIVWQIIRIVLAVSEDRKQKVVAESEAIREQAKLDAEARESQAKELEELRRKLAALEGTQDGGGKEAPDDQT